MDANDHRSQYQSTMARFLPKVQFKILIGESALIEGVLNL